MAWMNKHPLADCDNCPLLNNTLVPSHGRQDASVAVVGEAPGRTEVTKGRPFVGPSGKLLDLTMKEVGVDPADTYRTNTVLCKPPTDKDGSIKPPQKAIDCCRPRLKAEIAALNEGNGPKYVLALGNFAATEFLGYKTRITRDRIGPPREVNGYTVIPSIHPAAVLRSPDNFLTFENDIGKLVRNIPEWKAPQYEVFDDPDETMALLDGLPQGVYAVDIETSVEKDITYEHPDKLLCIGIAIDRSRCVVISSDALASTVVLSRLREWFAENDIIYQNGKFDVGVLHKQGLIPDTKKSIFFDTMLASYCLDERPGYHSLEAQSMERLYSPNWKHMTKQYESFDYVPSDVLYEYNAYDVANTYALYELLYPSLAGEKQRGLHNMLCRISEHLLHIELRGIKVDTELLEQLDDEFTDNLHKMEEQLKRWVDNPRSPQQIKAALNYNFGIVTQSTDKDHLTELQTAAKHQLETPALLDDLDDDEVAGWNELYSFTSLLLHHRKETKLLGTYVRGISNRLTPEGRIQTNLTLNSTTTGRTSSKNPNLQNIPRGSTIRSAFIPDSPDYQLIYADFANIEGRVVCVLSGDTSLQEIILSGTKVHNVVAEHAFGKDFSSEEYVAAKSVVHGVNYARTPHGIAEGLGIPLHKAKTVYNAYLDLAPGLPQWHAEIREAVIERQEELVTPFGRRRRFPLITRFNSEDVFKEAIAFKPQSIASDINTLAGCKLNQLGYDVRLLVHDAVLIQVPREEAAKYQRYIAIVMEQEAQDKFMSKFPDFEMPFPVEPELGENWGELDG